MKLSKKKESELYNIVYEEIIQARIKIAKLLNGQKNGVYVDNILADLQDIAPQKAIDLFKTKSK